MGLIPNPEDMDPYPNWRDKREEGEDSKTPESESPAEEEMCPYCGGSGGEGPDYRLTCSVCNGSGKA